MSDLQKNENWKASIYTRGAIAGALIGLMAAHFYARASEESNNGPNRISASDSMRLLVAILSLIRQFTELGGNNRKK